MPRGDSTIILVIICGREKGIREKNHREKLRRDTKSIKIAGKSRVRQVVGDETYRITRIFHASPLCS